MNYFPLILAVVTAVLFNFTNAKIEEKKKIELIKTCQREVNAADHDVELAISHKPPVTHEGKCIIACVFKKYEIMIDRKLSLEKVYKYFEAAFDEQEKRDRGIKIVAACFAKEDIKGLDECETAAKYMICVFKHPDFADLVRDT